MKSQRIKSAKQTRDARRPRRMFGAVLVVSTAALALSGLLLHAQRNTSQAVPKVEQRNFDARTSSAAASTSLRQPTAPSFRAEALRRLRAATPDLMVTADEVTGGTRSIYNATGFLSGPASGDPLAVGLSWVMNNLDALGLVSSDLLDYEITDRVYSKVTGVTHIYLRQRLRGIAVYNAQLHLNVNREGRMLSVNNQFVPNLATVAPATRISLGAADAVGAFMKHYGQPLGFGLAAGSVAAGPERQTRLNDSRVSRAPIDARLMYLPVRPGEVRLVWNFQVKTLDSRHHFDSTVDAASGEVWTRFDWAASDSYRVIAAPAESPNHTAPSTPADGRVLVTNPADATASPHGWHDTDNAAGAEHTTHRGNNVHAYDDTNSDHLPPVVEPDCGAGLACDFAVDFAEQPDTYTSAGVTNLFYWTNLVHDTQYRFGFDEEAGNFQANNYGALGEAGDYLLAEAQDGSGLDNANMNTPPDGESPTMQLYLWSPTDPNRDSAFDAGLIVHEYGHGISNRLVGGPSNVSCLGNVQQPGEGLSDWWALVYTAKAADAASDGRGMGTYLLGQLTTGLGIRDQRYSMAPGINNWTYQSIRSAGGPHPVGQVWAQAAWEVYWALVTEYGFQPIYGPVGTAGNHRAMLYINEGLKNTACSPTFTDVRDGIIQAAEAMDLDDGADVCLLWDAFADFGLGSDAISGGSGSTNVTNGFNKPLECGGTPLATVSIADATVAEGHSGQANASVTVSLSAPYSGFVSVDYATSELTASSTVYLNTGGVTINEVAQATPYPSTIAVPSLGGTVTKATVTLRGFSHTYSSDVDMLLVGPTGQTVVLMSDAGGVLHDAVDLDLVFDDAGPSLPGGPFSSGTYKPTNISDGEGNDDYVAPAPAGPYGTTLAAFNGLNPSGNWRLYIMDDFAPDQGSIRSWSLNLTVSPTTADYVSVAGRLTFSPGQTSKTILIPVIGDTTVESNETVGVTLSNVAAAIMGDSSAVLTILNDDGVSAQVTSLWPVNNARTGAISRLWAYVHNTGSAPMPSDATVRFYVAGLSDPWVGSASVAGLASGVTAWYFYDWPVPVTLAPGNYTYQAQVFANSAAISPLSATQAFAIQSSSLTERIVAGLDDYSNHGGWFASRKGLEGSFAAGPWAQLPWPAYNATGGGLHLAAGDVDGDGLDEVVAGTGPGGAGWLAVFDDAAHGFALLKWIQVARPTYNSLNGEVWPAVGDLDGDGRAEIVAGLGGGGEGFFQIFDDAAANYASLGLRQITWPAYNASGAAGAGATHPAIGNVDGVGPSEIIVGLGQTGGGWIEVFTGSAGAYSHQAWIQVAWPAYNTANGATFPAAGDIDGDGRAEIVAGLGSGGAGWLVVFDDANANYAPAAWLRTSWPAFNTSSTGETHPAVGNLDGDGRAEIVIGLSQHSGEGGWLEILDDTLASYASIGWRNLDWGAYRAAGGGLYPAVGRFQ